MDDNSTVLRRHIVDRLLDALVDTPAVLAAAIMLGSSNVR
jgi:hypothetical protein